MARSEIESLEIAFRSAQARLGIAAGLVTRDEWMGLSISAPAKGSYGLMMRLLRLILGLRSMSRRLTKSYYRYARGLETGYTLSQDGEDTTLNELRDEFEADLERVKTLDFDWPDMTAEERYAAAEMKSVSRGDTAAWKPGELSQSLVDWNDSIVTPDGKIKGEKFDWTEDRIQNLQDAVRRWRDEIGYKGIKNFEAKVRAIKQRYADDPDRMLAEIEDAFILVRDSLSGVIDKAAIDSGRELIDDVVVRDKRVKLYARGVRENPCHFCSMLASRGFVYGSAKDAVSGWHPNCHCYAIVRWSNESGLPERNQYYYDMWPEVTNGYYGKDKMKAWRRWIAKQRVKRGGKL